MQQGRPLLTSVVGRVVEESLGEHADMVAELPGHVSTELRTCFTLVDGGLAAARLHHWLLRA
ncbi:hypothetical protein ACP70R_046796 [Stipagrostis hirtigluma subsp. patula]